MTIVPYEILADHIFSCREAKAFFRKFANSIKVEQS